MVKISFDSPTPAAANNAPVTLGEDGAAQMSKILHDAGKTYVRIRVVGGGCNGFSYKFELADDYTEDDVVVTSTDYPDAKVIIDNASHALIAGSVIRYKQSLEASQFVIENPNAKSSCGCGSSFGV